MFSVFLVLYWNNVSASWKIRFTLHEKEDIDYAFITCVIIHNMILKFYGTEYEIHRDKLNPKGGEDHDNIEEENDGHRKCIDQFFTTLKSAYQLKKK